MARNIVRFAGGGEIVVEVVERPRRGIAVVARDTGPGIADVEQALTDGYSTYDGLGLGLPGARRLMDEFARRIRGGRGHDRDHDQVVEGRMTMTRGLTRSRRETEPADDSPTRATGRTRSSCCRSWWRTCATTDQAAGGVGQPDPARRTCSRR